jgi:hypothetical protein
VEEESKQKDKEGDERRKQAARAKMIASKICKKKASGKNDKWQVARERSKRKKKANLKRKRENMEKNEEYVKERKKKASCKTASKAWKKKTARTFRRSPP